MVRARRRAQSADGEDRTTPSTVRRRRGSHDATVKQLSPWAWRVTAPVPVTVVPLPIRQMVPLALTSRLNVRSSTSKSPIRCGTDSRTPPIVARKPAELLAQGSDLRLIGGCDWDRE